MTDPIAAERIVLRCHHTSPKIYGEIGSTREGACAPCISTALAEARQEVCSETIAEAQALGYLNHADACRKGIDSETCTCGIMSWLPSAMGGTSRRSRAQPP